MKETCSLSLRAASAVETPSDRITNSRYATGNQYQVKKPRPVDCRSRCRSVRFPNRERMCFPPRRYEAPLATDHKPHLTSFRIPHLDSSISTCQQDNGSLAFPAFYFLSQMSSTVNEHSTCSFINGRNHSSGWRPLPAVQPSTIRKPDKQVPVADRLPEERQTCRIRGATLALFLESA